MGEITSPAPLKGGAGMSSAGVGGDQGPPGSPVSAAVQDGPAVESKGSRASPAGSPEGSRGGSSANSLTVVSRRASHASHVTALTRLTWPQTAHTGLFMRMLLNSLKLWRQDSRTSPQRD